MVRNALTVKRRYQAWLEYHKLNPWLYEAFVRRVKLIYNGRFRHGHKPHYSARHIFDYFRLHDPRPIKLGKDDIFRINNNHIAFYVQLLYKEHSEYEGFFETRGGGQLFTPKKKLK